MRPLCLVALAWCAPKCAIQLHHDDGSDMLAIATRRRNASAIKDFASCAQLDMLGFSVEEDTELVRRVLYTPENLAPSQFLGLLAIAFHGLFERRRHGPATRHTLVNTERLGDVGPGLALRAQHG